MFVRRLASQIGQASPPFSPQAFSLHLPSTSRCQSKHKASNRWAGAYLHSKGRWARHAGQTARANFVGPGCPVLGRLAAFPEGESAQAFPAKRFQKVPSLGLPASPDGAQVRWTLKKHPASLRPSRAFRLWRRNPTSGLLQQNIPSALRAEA